MNRVAALVVASLIALVGCDKVNVVENPGEFSPTQPGLNKAPTVNAGEDVTIEWPVDEVQLQGSGQDDGLPSGKLMFTWRAADESVSFDDRMDAETIARFAAPGSYTLVLSATDGKLQVNDSIIVTVKPEGGENHAPVVDAGADQQVELWMFPQLTGTVTDDGLPGTGLEIEWSMASGPGTATFADPTQAETTVSFDTLGTYELLLTVSDGELTASDSLTIQVDPAVYPAPDLSDEVPDRGWLRVPPEEMGMNAVLLQQAEQYAAQAGGAGLISRRGRLVHSWGNIDERFELKSTTKSIGAIALAMAMDEGRLALNDRAIDHLPTFGVPPETNDPAWIAEITLKQLANHTAGFEKTGAYGRLMAAPGTQWRYSDGGLNWLADVLTNTYAQDLQDMFIARLYPVLGINAQDDLRWRRASSGFRPEPRPNGIEHREFASGMIGNANTLARVGLLYLRLGQWEGGVRIFSPTFPALVATPAPEAADVTVIEPQEYPDAARRYGLLWWTNKTGALPEVPTDAYWAWGLGDSLIVVIPSLDLVVARVGPIGPPTPGQRVFGDNDWNGDYAVLEPFLNPIVEAVEE